MEGTPFGRYQLIELLGRGGMGEVWRAHDTSIGRVVALKMLLPHYAKDPAFEARFRREARAAARLDDPHIVPIYDVGEIDGRLYVTMRLIEGRDLQTLLDDGPLRPERAVHIIEQIASALHSAHRTGLVHRDVKPTNILLADGGSRPDFAYLIDFGIARATTDTALTSANTTLGTWAYMAPERFSTGDINPSSDIYALACVLFQCLTGRVPYPGETLEQIAVGHMSATPPRPSELQPGVPAAIDDVIATGLAKQPSGRYQSTVELADAARQAISDPTRAVPPPPGAPATPPTWSASDSTQAWPTGGEAPTAPAYIGAPPAPPATKRRRGPAVLIGILLAVILLVAGGVFAIVRFTGDDGPTAAEPSSAAAPSPSKAGPPPNTGPFTGMYRAEFGRATSLDGATPPGTAPSIATYGVRSVCTPKGCMATATKTKGGEAFAPTMEFDQVGDRWLSVTISPGECRGVETETWQVFRLQPRPDGTLAGEYVRSTADHCAEKRTVTFTRTGDVDYNADFYGVADPAELPARVVAPAEALRGRYHMTRTYSHPAIPPLEADTAVVTDCLRTGERCMSYFPMPIGDIAMIFEGGVWKTSERSESTCPSGDLSKLEVDGQYPLPEPRQDPIQTLTGHGTWNQVGGSCAGNLEFDETFTRTGD